MEYLTAVILVAVTSAGVMVGRIMWTIVTGCVTWLHVVEGAW